MEAEKRIYSLFSNVTSVLGYSEVHGRILAALLVSKKSLSLDQISKKIGYSISSISLSLDFLEIMDVIKRIKKPNDKKLYVQIQGDLLDCLRKIVLFKTKKNVENTLEEFEKYKSQGNSTVNALEKELKRLKRYIELLSKVKIP
ncbi:MAG: hypothetical protein J7L08_01540 [Candidatus Aenigmarchaeota archaeon]|nr:hypothetical protein [Candidatus Aenigmarchaeota archaeon]